MAFFSRGTGQAEPGHVRAFKEDSTPLVVVIDGVVDGDVHGPKVAVLVGVEQRRLVFNPLRNPVGQPAVGAVISGLEPRIGAHRFVGKSANIVELERNGSVGVLVRVGIKFGTHVKEGGAFAVEDEGQRRVVHHEGPIFAGSRFNPHVQFARQSLGCIQACVFHLTGGEVKPF